ncbi:hypothetical protein [Natrialba chahannaoensis]|uniref:hypothetical protein n=1 Tax=Natrialba chahannaoensis TaxID=68911 RepID=UPI0006775A65|nr:hypothetical protein [Natrialba chahannaoensis]
MPTAYCGVCEWTHTVTAEETTDLDLAMIDHHVDTGHSPIERADLVEPIAAETGDQHHEDDATVDATARTELE